MLSASHIGQLAQAASCLPKYLLFCSDLKPENLLLREVQTPGIIPVQGTLLVSDFGILP